VGPELGPDSEGLLRLNLCGDPAEQAWPYPCSQAAGNPLRVDPNCGLYAPPPPKATLVTASGATAVLDQAVPVAFTTVETAAITINNPSACYPATVLRLISVDVDFSLPAGASAHATARLAGNEYYDMTNPAPAAGTSMPFTHMEYTMPLTSGGTVPAGGSLAFTADIEVGQGAGNARYRGCRWSITALVMAGLT
jgi:hypothetical protein